MPDDSKNKFEMSGDIDIDLSEIFGDLDLSSDTTDSSEFHTFDISDVISEQNRTQTTGPEQKTGSQRTKVGAQRPKSDIQRGRTDTQRPKAGMQPAKPDAQRPKADTQRPKADTQRPKAGTRPAGTGAKRPGLSAGRPVSAAENSKPGTESTKPMAHLDTGSPDFDIDFDFDSEYRDKPDQDRPLRLRREKRTGCVGGLLYAVFVICISLVLASLMWMAASDVLGFGTADEQVSVTIPRDFDVDSIADMLYDAELIRYRFIFRIYADYSNAMEKIVPGSYMLNRNHDYRALVHGMTARSGARVETTVTIPEGFTLAEIFARLEDFGVVNSADELWEAAANHHFDYHFLDRSTLGDRFRLEGFLFPETYNFFLDSNPVQVISRMLAQFDRVFTEEYNERVVDMGYTVKEIVIIASLIEREAGDDEERPRIAAVIYNRLENWGNTPPLLQIDAALIYAATRLGRLPSIDLDIESPYNTYLHEGLPPGPIASPGIASLQAALYPDTTNEFFYALNLEGTHDFFRTYEQHRAFVQSDQFGGR